MAALKYVPLTTIAMAENCTPFIVLILAYFTLSERTTFLQFTATVVAVIGASIVIIGAPDSESKDELDQEVDSEVDSETSHNHAAYPLFVYVLIIAGPAIKSTATILMRMLKKLNPMTVLSWQNISLMFVAIAYVYASGSDLSLLKKFDWVDWVVVFAMGLATVFAQKYFTIMT